MSSAKVAPFLSLVVPMCNESKGVSLFFETVLPILQKCTKNWEVICIDDGSQDETYSLLVAQRKKDKRIKLVKLSRNFGKEVALSAGLDYTQGDAVIPMDADLQDPPELIPDMVKKWQKGAPLVLAVRRSRTKRESFFKRSSAWLFYKMMGVISNPSLPKNTGDFRLMDRRVVEAVKSMPERTRFMKGMFAWVGFPHDVVYYERPARAQDVPKQSYRALLMLALDGMFSFSTFPLKIWLYLGVLISLLSFVYGAIIVAKVLFWGVDVPGYASIITAVLFMGGIQLIGLSVQSQYIARIYKEVKQRPLYIVEAFKG